jgi:hypothetical protein
MHFKIPFSALNCVSISLFYHHVCWQWNGEIILELTVRQMVPVSEQVTLMVEAARTSETLVNFYQTTRRYNPEDSHLGKPVLIPWKRKLVSRLQQA